jgi:hypothetical protein
MVLPEGWLQRAWGMLIRGEKIEVSGEAAFVAGPGSIAPASLPTLIIGLLLLIGP